MGLPPIDLQVNSTDSIYELKLRLLEHWDVPPDRQHILGPDGAELSDSLTLEVVAACGDLVLHALPG